LGNGGNLLHEFFILDFLRGSVNEEGWRLMIAAGEVAFLSAKGAASYKPGATPQVWSLALTSDFKRILIGLASSYKTSYI
jgi:hypothetical protein